MKQTVTSKYEPKSKNVTWIDMSTGSPVLKNYINGMWRPTGGGGGNSGGDSGGDSGCNCSIQTIDKNTQPNIGWRDATAEDQAKFNSSPIISVAELPDGKLPLLMVTSYIIEGEVFTNAQNVSFVKFPTESEDGEVELPASSVLIAKDWSLLGILGEG